MRRRNRPVSLNRRDVLAWASSIAAFALVGPSVCAHTPFDAIVGEDDGSGIRTFESLAAALAAKGTTPYRILLRTGIWREKIVIRAPGVQLIGEGQNKTVLSYDSAAGSPGPDGRAWGTAGSATLTIAAPDCTVRRMTVENSFDYLGTFAGTASPGVGSTGAQAVALALVDGAERTWIDDVHLIGHQDTLLVDHGVSLFQASRISGSVDFIFGAGRALFQHCEIVSRSRPGLQRNQGFISAPSTPRDMPFGLVFRQCRLLREAAVPPASVVLGRPYRPRRHFADGTYGDPDAVGAAAFLDCWMDDHISADGWDEMFFATSDGSRQALSPRDARLTEYASRGPGAFRNRRRVWLSAAEAAHYRRERVLDGWAPG